MKSNKKADADDLLPEYDFDYTKAERGKFFRQLLKEGANIVVLEPDVAAVFRGSNAVNDALRTVIQNRRNSRRSKTRPTAPKRTATKR